jgi:hypothetical protein
MKITMNIGNNGYFHSASVLPLMAKLTRNSRKMYPEEAKGKIKIRRASDWLARLVNSLEGDGNSAKHRLVQRLPGLVLLCPP